MPLGGWWVRAAWRELVNEECLRAYSGVSDEHKGLLVDGGFVHGETLMNNECLQAYSGLR